MDLEQIRADLVGSFAGLTVTVTGIGELEIAGYQDTPSSPQLPCVYCGFPTELRDFAWRGSCIADLTLTVCVSRADESTAQAALSALLSAMLAVPIPTGLAFTDVATLSVNNIRATTFGEINVLAADINFSLRTT